MLEKLYLLITGGHSPPFTDYLFVQQFWKIECFIFSDQTFNIHCYQVVGLQLIEAQLFKIKDAVGRVTFVTGNRDPFFRNIPVKKIQVFGFLLGRQRFFIMMILIGLAGFIGIEGQLVFAVVFCKNRYPGNEMT